LPYSIAWYNHQAMPLNQVNNIILVLSGKGGVGKSSVTTQLALSFSLQGYNVGVLDLDLTGPNAPRFFGIEEKKVTMVEGGLGAVTVHEARDEQSIESPQNGSSTQSTEEPANTVLSDLQSKRRRKLGHLSVMSLGFILSTRSTAIIWRGPKKTAMVRQFLTQSAWPVANHSSIDVLLVDTPPGTSDEHISLLETLLAETALPGAPRLAGAVVVTTPQAVATSDVRKELSFCTKTNTPVLGVVENMAGFVCPHCAECTDIFSKGGGEIMATEYGVPFLGRVPIDPMFGRLIEEGAVPTYPVGTVVGGRDASTVDEAATGDGKDLLLVEKYAKCSLWPIFDGIVTKLMEDIESSRTI
jgi:Mrp family chromosome partitioning ATPase